MYINQRLYVPSIEECILYVLFGLTILYLVNIYTKYFLYTKVNELNCNYKKLH